MTVQGWLMLLSICCGVIGSVTTWGFVTGRWTNEATNNVRRLHEQLEDLKEDLDRRFKKAGDETSRAMSYIQGMELRMFKDYMNKEVADERHLQVRRELDRLDNDIENVRRMIGDRRNP